MNDRRCPAGFQPSDESPGGRFKLTRPPAAWLAVALAALVLKLHYSRAAGEQLIWILQPTAALVQAFSGWTFEWEPGAGFLCRSQHLLIAPACAGVNFLIIAYVAANLGWAGGLQSPARRWAWAVLTLPAAGLLTVGVNAMRILLSARLYAVDLPVAWLTADRLHRLAGVLLYLAALALWAGILERIAPRPNRRRGTLLPVKPILGVYLAGTLAVPMLRRLWHPGSGPLLEHVATVAGGSLLFLGFVIAAKLCCTTCIGSEYGGIRRPCMRILRFVGHWPVGSRPVRGGRCHESRDSDCRG